MAASCFAQTIFMQTLRRGDMFVLQGWDTSGRLSVPSDREHRGDLFKPLPTFIGPSDMFRFEPRPFYFGAADMFPRKPSIQPVLPLFTYPDQ